MKILKSAGYAALFGMLVGLPAMAFASPSFEDTGDQNHGVATKKAEHDKDKGAEFPQVSVKEAASLHKDGKIVMVDANGEATRKKEGYVPGAILLSNYKKYDEKELKASKKDTLVFYCGSEKCSAAPKAAKLASDKGYQVKVMNAGIKGWIKAGYKTKKL